MDRAHDPGPAPTNHVRFTVHLTPRGGADRIDGVRDGVLRARVAAPPVDGAANGSLVRLLARELGIATGAVRIVSGVGARVKTVAVDGVRPEALKVRWPDLTV